MSAITTHVLDAVLGKPAVGIVVTFEEQRPDGWIQLATTATDADGRCRNLVGSAGPGIYRLTFVVKEYFYSHKRQSIYPEISITFYVDGEQNYHIPLLLSDNSFTTYRGS